MATLIDGKALAKKIRENLKIECEELKQKNSELEQSLRELENIKTENAKLKDYLNLTEKYGEYKTIPGYVINKDISNYSKTLVINVGSDNGIKEKMTVIIITHNSAIAPMADKVIHFKNGKAEDIIVNKNPTSIDEIEW